jgi:hypothetical protein
VPRKANNAPPAIIVITTANQGVSAVHIRDGEGRFSSRNM